MAASDVEVGLSRHMTRGLLRGMIVGFFLDLIIWKIFF